jgi:hypothetical protein
VKSKAQLRTVLFVVFLGTVATMTSCNRKSEPLSGSPPLKASAASETAGLVGGYELPAKMVIGSCPFNHEYQSMDGLLKTIQGQLEIKSQGEEDCQAGQKRLLQSLSAISTYYSQIDRTRGQKQGVEVYQNFLMEMQAQLQELKSKNLDQSVEAANLRIGIMDMRSRFQDASYDLAVTRADQQQQQKTDFRRELFQQLNSAILTMGELKPQCVQRSGGWNQILPPLLGVAALASGTSIFTSQALVGSGLQVASSFALLFQNREAKEAFRQIISLNNQKVLACTYYSLQHSACELRRGLRLIEKNKEEMKSLYLPEASHASKDHPEWRSYLDLYAKIPGLLPILDAIASQGSILSLDTELLNKYTIARKVKPDLLKRSMPPPEASDDEKQRWLQLVNRSGLYIGQFDGNGNPLTLERQLENATTQIEQGIRTIAYVEASLRESKSFESLKHTLNAKDPQLANTAKKIGNFLYGQANLVSPENRGSLLMSQEIMTKLEAFLNVKITESSEINAYLDRLSQAGAELFKAIALGSVAQIDRQEILALGSKSYERISNAFRLIENRFISADIEAGVDFKDSFLSYKQEKLLLFQLAEIYSEVNGSGSTFRDLEIDTAYSSFEKGFGEDLIEMLDTALKSRSANAPELKSASAPHFCSLLSGFLKSNNGFKASGLLKRCREEFKTLKISTLFYNSTERIDYDDQCSYTSYIRKERSFQVLDWLKRSQQP